MTAKQLIDALLADVRSAGSY